MSSADDNAVRSWRTWYLRIASIAGIVVLLALIGVLARRGNLAFAIPLLFVIPVLATMLSISWTVGGSGKVIRIQKEPSLD